MFRKSSALLFQLGRSGGPLLGVSAAAQDLRPPCSRYCPSPRTKVLSTRMLCIQAPQTEINKLNDFNTLFSHHAPILLLDSSSKRMCADSDHGHVALPIRDRPQPALIHAPSRHRPRKLPQQRLCNPTQPARDFSRTLRSPILQLILSPPLPASSRISK